MPAKKKIKRHTASVGDAKAGFVSKKAKRKGMKKLKTDRRKKSDAMATRDTMREINGGRGGEDDDSEAEEEAQRAEAKQDALEAKQEQARKKRRLEPLDFSLEANAPKQTDFARVFWKEALPGPEDTAALNEHRKGLGILVKGDAAASCPRPVMSIDDLALPEEFPQVMRAHGYTQPSLIQQQCWPAILGGNDVLCLAETGSGKTLGYLLPIVPHFLAAQKADAAAARASGGGGVSTGWTALQTNRPTPSGAGHGPHTRAVPAGAVSLQAHAAPLRHALSGCLRWCQQVAAGGSSFGRCRSAHCHPGPPPGPR
jgi:hypothetical protein